MPCASVLPCGPRRLLALTLGACIVGLLGCDSAPIFTPPAGQLVSAQSLTLGHGTGEQGAWRRDHPDGGTRSREPGIDQALALPADVVEPPGYRASVPLSPDSWLVAELYSRRSDARVEEFLATVPDPDNSQRQVISLTTREHTDGLVLRSRSPLPESYRISLRIGHIAYGGLGKLNGYDSGDETGEPWMRIPATGHNGIYWATIMDTLPEPRSNVWSHHHRKFFIDAWNYRKRMLGVTVAGVDGCSTTDPRVGKAFIAHDGHAWRRNSVAPAFHYRPDRWYQVVVERSRGAFHFSIEGDFHGIGRYRFADSLPIEKSCIYHFNRSPAELDESCLLGDALEAGGRLAEVWPSGSAYPDYFMMGDPHINFYEGSLLVDDLRLEAL